jgi:hypothetical protein
MYDEILKKPEGGVARRSFLRNSGLVAAGMAAVSPVITFAQAARQNNPRRSVPPLSAAVCAMGSWPALSRPAGHRVRIHMGLQRGGAPNSRRYSWFTHTRGAVRRNHWDLS